ncbi:MAG: methylmalonyl-CoA mutase [Planctomycetes bacterium]|nr:methylmalonyl-CoA mutase [Planctomycetota bacterium]
MDDPSLDRWRRDVYSPFVARHPERQPAFETPSGLEPPPTYALPEQGVDAIGPGDPPYVRGIYPSMYRGRIWTMRQYAGFSSPRETNERFRFLLEQGQTGLSVAFDLPTQIGYDSDDALARGEVGRVGVPISTLDDLDELFQGIPLDRVSISMTINATASILIAALCALARRRGIAEEKLRGTVQNDILKEFVARGTQRFPVAPSLRLATDVIEFATQAMPRFHPVSISGYHIREAGSTAIEEVAFTLSNGIAYLEQARSRGLDLERVGHRLSFFFNAHNHLFEEIAKFRAARELWYRICTERFGMTDPQACQLRFHSQTGGSTLTAQEPENNVVRVTIQALAAALGGTQSLHTNGADEALSLPTPASAKLALRTQQILARESGVTEVADPLGGCPYVEDLTTRVRDAAAALIAEIDRQGGTVAAIENGFVRGRIEDSAFETQKRIDDGSMTPVGVEPGGSIPDAPFVVDPRVEDERRSRLADFRANRDEAAAQRRLDRVGRDAAGDINVIPAIIDALGDGATLGEIVRKLVEVHGEYRDVE